MRRPGENRGSVQWPEKDMQWSLNIAPERIERCRLKQIIDERYSSVIKVRLFTNNLNIHNIASLYEIF